MKDKPNPVNIESNKRFVRFRKEVFGSQEEAARFLGIKQPMISRIERGIHILEPEYRKKLVHEKGLNAKWYDTGIGNMLMNKEDKKRPTINVIQELQDDVDMMRSEIESLRTNMKKLLQMIGELKDKIEK